MKEPRRRLLADTWYLGDGYVFIALTTIEISLRFCFKKPLLAASPIRRLQSLYRGAVRPRPPPFLNRLLGAGLRAYIKSIIS